MSMATEYLNSLLQQQTLNNTELDSLRALRAEIEQKLSENLNGNPRFYYGGSFGKRTMIREVYDLDLVVYWPNTDTYPIKDIYDAVGGVLQSHWKVVKSKTVAWELPFEGGFHIDVVPGRALDANFNEANLYRTDTKTTLKTSLKTHIDTVRNSGRSDAIRLMKLWRTRKKVPFKKSFLLELMTIEGCKGKRFDDIEGQLHGALEHIRDKIETCSIKDPANSNNSLSDDLSKSERCAIKQHSDAAIKATSWGDLF
jgi:hypothetical protein